MQLSLNVQDRLLLANIIPAQGDFVTLTARRALIEKVQLTPQEIQDFELKEVVVRKERRDEEGKPVMDKEGHPIVDEIPQLQWNAAKMVKKDVEVSDVEADAVAKVLKTLEEKQKLPDTHFELYKTFVVDRKK